MQVGLGADLHYLESGSEADVCRLLDSKFPQEKLHGMKSLFGMAMLGQPVRCFRWLLTASHAFPRFACLPALRAFGLALRAGPPHSTRRKAAMVAYPTITLLLIHLFCAMNLENLFECHGIQRFYG